ncbi:MAG: hypothetical protein V3V08_23400 [Nannocystaceae bacterium]
MRHPATPPAPYPQIPPEFRYMLEPPLFILPLVYAALDRSLTDYYDKLQKDLRRQYLIPKAKYTLWNVKMDCP